MSKDNEITQWLAEVSRDDFRTVAGCCVFNILIFFPGLIIELSKEIVNLKKRKR